MSINLSTGITCLLKEDIVSLDSLMDKSDTIECLYVQDCKHLRNTQILKDVPFKALVDVRIMNCAALRVVKFGFLKRLTILFLSNNQITSLYGITPLINLTMLAVDGNKISNLNELNYLQVLNLKHLYL